MKIIGHRGAAGLALENTLEGIRAAVAAGVDGVEFDVRVTRDRQLVLCHDNHLGRVAKDAMSVADHTLAELRTVPLNNGEPIPTLAEALAATGDKIAYIEPKVGGISEELLSAIADRPDHLVVVTTFNHQLAQELERRRPQVTVYLAEHFRPIEIFHFIRHAKANGLTLHAWLLNPLTYWLIHRRGLELMVYTVNSRLRYRFIKHFYPATDICTDRPDRFKKRLRTK